MSCGIWNSRQTNTIASLASVVEIAELRRRYVEEEDEVFRYRRAFDRLSDLALDEQESRDTLVKALQAWSQEG